MQRRGKGARRTSIEGIRRGCKSVYLAHFRTL